MAAAAVIKRKTLAVYQKKTKHQSGQFHSVLLRCGELDGMMIDIPPRGWPHVTKRTCAHSELDSNFSGEDWLESRADILVGVWSSPSEAEPPVHGG